MAKQTKPANQKPPVHEPCPHCERPPDVSGLEVENDRLTRRIENLEQELINCSMTDKQRELEYQKEVATLERLIKVKDRKSDQHIKHLEDKVDELRHLDWTGIEETDEGYRSATRRIKELEDELDETRRIDWTGIKGLKDELDETRRIASEREEDFAAKVTKQAEALVENEKLIAALRSHRDHLAQKLALKQAEQKPVVAKTRTETDILVQMINIPDERKAASAELDARLNNGWGIIGLNMTPGLRMVTLGREVEIKPEPVPDKATKTAPVPPPADSPTFEEALHDPTLSTEQKKAIGDAAIASKAKATYNQVLGIDTTDEPGPVPKPGNLPNTIELPKNSVKVKKP